LVGKDSAKTPAWTRSAMVQCTGIKRVFAPEWADARGAFAMDAAGTQTAGRVGHGPRRRIALAWILPVETSVTVLRFLK